MSVASAYLDSYCGQGCHSRLFSHWEVIDLCGVHIKIVFSVIVVVRRSQICSWTTCHR